MTNNARIFQDYLQSQNINLNFMDSDNGDTLIDIRESLDGGIKARIGVIFDNDDKMISVLALDFIGGINPSKRNYLIDLVNEINNKYTYFKFVVKQDNIEIQSFLLLNDNFDPSVLMQVIFGMMDCIKSEYSNIMRIMWS